MYLVQWTIKMWNKLFGSTTVTTDDTPNNQPEEINMSKKALCVAINDYPRPGNDLSGCVNDCNDWAAFLSAKGFAVNKLIDKQATQEGILEALSSMLASCVTGDVAVFTYSGHGSSVVDVDGDEPDGKDETLYTYDGHLTDDALRAVIDRMTNGVRLTVILDSCHSGTATRVLRPDAPKARYMPPTDPRVRELCETLPSTKSMLSEAEMVEVLFAGCKSSEYSYDAIFGGRPNGAFTRVALDVLNKNSDLTYAQLYEAIKKRLPSDEYPQTPQFEGSEDSKNRKAFA